MSAQVQDKNYRILIVDDNQNIINSLSLFFKNSGYEFIGLTDPIEAINRIKQEHFDILILGFIIPPLTGDEIVRESFTFYY